MAERFRLPDLRATVKLNEHPLWDVKFYPYHDVGERHPIFALVSSTCLLICRIDENDEFAMSVLLSIKLDDEGVNPQTDSLNSCAWCYTHPDQPLLAIAGDNGQVNIIDALTGECLHSLLGHGIGTINDLSTHPTYPWIIASASMDASARIWDLRRVENAHESTCIIICGHGQAHEEGLLAVSWHSSGRYIVTGGHDQKICIWTLPDLDDSSDFWASISKEHRKRSSDEVHIVHYPHFISSAVHNNYVDTTVFFGDLVISKAAEENKIVLWQITGFNSQLPPPQPESAPKTNEYLDTRNGFIRKAARESSDDMVHIIDERYSNKPPYLRLLEFEAPRCKFFYMRFGFLQPSPAYPHLHPTLAIGNLTSDIFFWDFECLLLGHDGGGNRLRSDEAVENNTRKPLKIKKGIATKIQRGDQLHRLVHGQSPVGTEYSESSRRSPSIATASTSQFRETSTEATSHTSEIRPSTEGQSVRERNRFALDNPHKPLKAHKIIKKGFDWTARAADWSSCGRWCVVVGEQDGVGVAAVTKKPD